MPNDKRQLDDVLFHEDHVHRPDIQYGGSVRIEEWTRTFKKSVHAKIDAASIWFPMRSRSVICGTVSRTQSAMQLATQSFAAAQMMPWFAFTMKRQRDRSYRHYLVAAVIKGTSAAFQACVTCFRSRTIDVSRSLIEAKAFSGSKLRANASRNA